MNSPRLVVLTGSGFSAESGISTYRDMGGIWEKYDIIKVASPEAWQSNPELVIRFYNERRKQLFDCHPNKAHLILAELEKYFEVSIITQNVDNLHECAGSSRIIHLHCELKKVRSTVNPEKVYNLSGWELKIGDNCEFGSQLRHHIVWFGEDVPFMPDAIALVQKADIFLVAGTSLNVYPAAGLLNYIQPGVTTYIIDPEDLQITSYNNIAFIKEKASEGIEIFKTIILKKITSQHLNA